MLWLYNNKMNLLEMWFWPILAANRKNYVAIEGLTARETLLETES